MLCKRFAREAHRALFPQLHEGVKANLEQGLGAATGCLLEHSIKSRRRDRVVLDGEFTCAPPPCQLDSKVTGMVEQLVLDRVHRQ